MNFYAFVHGPGSGEVRHYSGFPPELTDGDDSRLPFTATRLIAMYEADAGWYVDRWAADGSIINDTFHESLEDARDYIRMEFGSDLGPLQEISPNLKPDDIHVYVIGLLGLETKGPDE